MSETAARQRPRRIPRPAPQPLVAGPEGALPTAPTLLPDPLLAPASAPENEVILGENESPSPTAEGQVASEETVAEEEVVTPEEAPPAPAPVELIIPPPPPDMAERSAGRARASSGRMRATGTATRAVPTADENTGNTRASVTEPETQTRAVAQAALTDALKTQPEPSPEIIQLCADIREKIKNKRPPDEDALLEADPEQDANEVGQDLQTGINNEAQGVEGEYETVNAPAEGTPEQVGVGIPPPASQANTPGANAANATPDPVPEEDLSLEADVAATQARREDAGMTSPAAEVITDPNSPVVQARESAGELEETAARDPAIVAAEQAEGVANSEASMADLQAQAMAALIASREGALAGAGQQQTTMAGQEVDKREQASITAENLFKGAKDAVNLLLEPMTRTAMERWNTGKTVIVQEFDNELQKAKDLVDERHSGIGGFFNSVGDYFAGLPRYITVIYDRAEKKFGEDICTLITDISVYVNGIILSCEEIIDNADTQIKATFDALAEEFPDWAAQQQVDFQGRLDGLRDDVAQAQQDFTKDLVNQAAGAVDEARSRIHALREAAKGLIQKVADAVAAFIDDPVRAIINGLLSLVGIAPAAFWALLARIDYVMEDLADDPMAFGNTVMESIGTGFDRFFDNFGTHLLSGFINWLFSAMGSVGVQIPADFSLKSIITFILQLLGLTWANIRIILVRHVGEENVGLLEKAYELLEVLINEGPGGIFEMIKDLLNPQAILDMIIEKAVEYMVTAIVEMATIRIIGLFNPVGAIVQVLEAIYKVFKWIFENAARIFALVETVVNGMADIIAGNVEGFINKVEQVLAATLVPIIDFVAGFLGLGDLPGQIAEVIGGFQEMILGYVDQAIGFLVNQARGLLSALGIGGGEDAGAGGDTDGEVGDEMRFSADGESHRMWIDTQGGVEVMVASEVETLDQKIARWRATVGEIPDETKQAEASTLLGQLDGDNADTESKAERTLEELQQAELAAEEDKAEQTAEANAQDDLTEAAQRGMLPKITRLFELFGEKSVLVEYQQDFAKVPTSAQQDVTRAATENEDAFEGLGSWSDVRSKLIEVDSTVGDYHQRPLGRASQSGAFQDANNRDIYEPAFQAALGKVAAERTQSADDYMPAAGHPSYLANRRPVVHRDSGAEAGEESSVGPAGRSLSELQAYLFDASKRGSAATALKDYFTLSIVGKREHANYKPDNITYQIKEGAFEFSYDYGAAAELGGADDFTTRIAVGEVDGKQTLDQSSSGNALRIKESGTRGRTASSGTIRNDGGGPPLHSAHLIADWFTGSGYGAAGNLILTSPDYNTGVMGGVEERIHSFITTGPQGPVDPETSRPQPATFSMEVTASLLELGDTAVVQELKLVVEGGSRKLDRKELNNILEETMKLLTGKRDPRITQRVGYSATGPGGNFSTNIGKDTGL